MQKYEVAVAIESKVAPAKAVYEETASSIRVAVNRALDRHGRKYGFGDGQLSVSAKRVSAPGVSVSAFRLVGQRPATEEEQAGFRFIYRERAPDGKSSAWISVGDHYRYFSGTLAEAATTAKALLSECGPEVERVAVYNANSTRGWSTPKMVARRAGPSW